jgi:hypothetical protein
VFGYTYDYPGCPMSCPPGPAGFVADDNLVLRFNGTTRGYEAELPGLVPGRLVLNASSTRLGYDITAGLSSTERQSAFANFSVFAISDAVGLQYSNHVHWGAALPGVVHERHGFFAFGVPAPAGAVPAGGARLYSGRTEGATTLFAVPDGDNDFFGLEGAGSLGFDFSAGTIAGSLTIDTAAFGREGRLAVFTFSGTISRGADVAFQGTISAPGVAESGTFEGRFTGPDASEIILRWRAPAIDPRTNRPLVAFGAFVGRMR